MEANDPPPIAALFEVVFDQKVGYSISWHRSRKDLDLDGVEYQCLPSGLHGVPEDLVYFVHGGCAGVSAFVQGEADESQRNASFIAVGALVSLSHGRLGKSWMYAEQLRSLARERVGKSMDAKNLERFWDQHREDDSAQGSQEPASPSAVRRKSLPGASAPSDPTRKRKRATSDAGADFDASSSADHPALSMADLLDTFGPLIFPLYRAALLRQRILLIGTPPVQQTCNFVYLLSILSSIPQTLAESLEPDSDAVLRIQTLFSVGVHDIPFLSDQKRERRWLACTTDDILGTKKDLYDIIVKLPASQQSSQTKQWPRIYTAIGHDVKATQRDLRRYRLLRGELERGAGPGTSYQDEPNSSEDSDGTPIASLARASTTVLLNEVKRSEPGETEVCEPVTWSAMAYNGFMWWASAGEMEAWGNEEVRADRQLLEEVPETEDLLQHIAQTVNDERTETQLKLAEATVLTAYFHRLTAEILEPLADAVASADDDTEEGIAGAAIQISDEDVRLMGLDAWSAADKQFIVDALDLYFGRQARVAEGGIRICGMRVC